jgi:hypothetical protein
VSTGPAIGSQPQRVSDELEGWLSGTDEKTLGSLIDLLGERGFAILFVLLLGVPALPLPTGGATHVFEIIAMLLALESIAGRADIWLPERWRRLELAGAKQQRFITGLLKVVRWVERLSRPRLRFLFGHRASNVVFGLLVIAGSLGAFLAPPFTGLDTLPALGVVLLALGVLLEDFLIVILALIVMAAGMTLEVVLGTAAFDTLRTIV